MKHARALVVEDNGFDRAYVRALLAAMRGVDVTVDEATTAEESDRMLRNHDYDLVISDYHLTGSATGLDVLSRARDSQPRARRILLTADQRLDIMTEAFTRAATDRVVRKTAGSREIVGNVMEVLSEPGRPF